MSFVLGIHFGEDQNKKLNLATPFNIIIKDIKDKLNDDNNNIEYNNKSSYIKSEEDGKVREYNIYNDQLIYEGEFSNGKRNGNGKEYKYGKLIYIGGFSNGKRNGKGKEYNYDDGKLIFEGEYLNGKKMEIAQNIIILMVKKLNAFIQMEKEFDNEKIYIILK